MNTLYTLGYAGWSPAQLAAAVERTGALLYDIRHRPWSKSPQWQQPALQALLGDAYRYLPALGNRNYNNDGPITLVDPERGAAIVARTLERRPVILLCGCKDHWNCHRDDAADLLRERIGCEVDHLYPSRVSLDTPPPPPPAPVIRLPDMRAVRERCAVQNWQGAYGALPPCPGKDGDPAALVAWRAAADYIEAEKARALAALTAEWRRRKEEAHATD